jgi:hypothetical protein
MKHEPIKLPTKDNALLLAASREAWAKQALELDRYGMAQELELTALLLRFYAEHIT